MDAPQEFFFFNFFRAEKIAINTRKKKTISDVPQNPLKFKIGQKSPHLATFLLNYFKISRQKYSLALARHESKKHKIAKISKNRLWFLIKVLP
jgi:hypothetical protein